MIKVCFASVDVERELGGLGEILSVFKKYGVKPTLFVTGAILKENQDLFKELLADYEIACHGFTHRFWNTLNTAERKEELDNFLNLYQRIFQNKPLGFRAPSHVIDQDGFKLVQECGFLYDSSIVPHYPPFKKYRGYRGRAPLNPYSRQGLKILEIPVRGQVLGIPLAAAWIEKLPLLLYRILFFFHRPEFITLNMHSWDVRNPLFCGKLEKLVLLLKSKNYQFLNGREIFQQNRK